VVLYDDFNDPEINQPTYDFCPPLMNDKKAIKNCDRGFDGSIIERRAGIPRLQMACSR